MFIINIAQIATPIGNKAHKGKKMQELSLLQDAFIRIEDGLIIEIGKMSELSGQEVYQGEVIDAQNLCAVPGFIDSHTHFIFGGYRAEEFVSRLQGASYMDIMKMGGGIMASVNATRNTPLKELITSGHTRLSRMLRQGVTTVEGKSGYGLELETECRQLEAMKELNKFHPIDIIPTFMGAHALPPEYKGRETEYITYLADSVLPVVAMNSLAKYCDVFCEDGVFDVEASRMMLEAGKKNGIRPRIHADEIVTFHGAELAVEVGAVSADHLLMVSEEGIRKLAGSDTIATLLPLTAFSLNKPYAPARKMIDEGCAIALASDMNPGSCFSDSVALIFALAVIQMKMTAEEALTAMTLNGAAALELADITGSIEVGKQADINLLAYPDYRFLVYHTASNTVEKVIKKGKLVYDDKACDV